MDDGWWRKRDNKQIPTVSSFSMGLDRNDPKFKASGAFSCFRILHLHNPKSRVLLPLSFPTIHNQPFPPLDPVYSLISSRYFFFQTDFHPILQQSYTNLDSGRPHSSQHGKASLQKWMVSLPPQTFPYTTGTIHLAYRGLSRTVADPDLRFLPWDFWGKLAMQNYWLHDRWRTKCPLSVIHRGTLLSSSQPNMPEEACQM